MADREFETVEYMDAPIKVEIDNEIRNLLIEALFKKSFDAIGDTLQVNNLLRKNDINDMLVDTLREVQGFLDNNRYGTQELNLMGLVKLRLSVTEEQGGNEYFNIAYNLTATFAMEDLNPIVHSVGITRWKGDY